MPDIKPELQKRFAAICKLIKAVGGDAPLRVAAHLRAHTGGKVYALGTYHGHTGYSDESKLETYATIIHSMAERDGDTVKPRRTIDPSKLLGQDTIGQGAKKAEVEINEHGDAVIAAYNKTVPRPHRIDPLAGAKEPVAQESYSPATPAPTHDVISVRHSQPTIPSDEGQEAKELAQAIQRIMHGRQQQPAALDEGRVRTIAKEVALTEVNSLDIEDTIKKAMGNGAFPVDRVKAIVDEAMANHVQRIEIVRQDGTVKPVEGRHHYKTGLLLACLSQRLNALLVGPAGGGKTTAALKASEALDLKFGAISVGPMTSKADLFGYKDATGNYHSTQTVDLATNGGVMLWDELDAGNGGVITYGNMLLANGHFATPQGMVPKHKDFVFIGGANTYGNGADRVYVGRNQLDGATLDRFVVIDWDYDEGLEGSLVGVSVKSPAFKLDEGGVMDPGDWIERVRKVREAAGKLKLRFVVSPRATVHGCKLFAAGVGRTHVENMVLWKGVDAATRQKVEADL